MYQRKYRGSTAFRPNNPRYGNSVGTGLRQVQNCIEIVLAKPTKESEQNPKRVKGMNITTMLLEALLVIGVAVAVVVLVGLFTL